MCRTKAPGSTVSRPSASRKPSCSGPIANSKVADLTRRESAPLERDEPAHRRRDARDEVLDVYLNDLVACARRCVRHVERRHDVSPERSISAADTRARRARRSRSPSRARMRTAGPRSRSRYFEVYLSFTFAGPCEPDVDRFERHRAADGRGAAGVLVRVVDRHLTRRARERHRQAPGRILIAEQQVDDRRGRLGAAVPDLEHGGGVVDPVGHDERAPVREYHDERDAGAGDRADEVGLPAGQAAGRCATLPRPRATTARRRRRPRRRIRAPRSRRRRRRRSRSPKNDTPSPDVRPRRRRRSRSASAMLPERRRERLRPRAEVVGRGRHRAGEQHARRCRRAAACRRCCSSTAARAAASGPARARPAVGATSSAASSTYGPLEQAERLLEPEHAGDGIVDARGIEGLRHPSATSDRQRRPSRCPGRRRRPCGRRRRGPRRRRAAAGCDAVGIADDDAAESPLGLEHIGQQRAVRVHRRAGDVLNDAMTDATPASTAARNGSR